MAADALTSSTTSTIRQRTPPSGYTGPYVLSEGTKTDSARIATMDTAPL